MSWFSSFTSEPTPPPPAPKTQYPSTPDSERTCPVARDPPPPTDSSSSDATCPVPKDSSSSINPRNFMPTYAQTPSPSQKSALPTTRTTSTIPKSSDDASIAQSTNWEYPSPQQFFNAVMKKGFTNTQEQDVPAMVQIHNAVNERAWREIQEWESTTSAASCGGVKLIKFRGDSRILTPKARVLGWFGYARPFDTHFWTVDRCGVEVEYVIDFYKGRQQGAGGDERKLQMPSFYLDVRPYGVEGFGARVKRALGVS